MVCVKYPVIIVTIHDLDYLRNSQLNYHDLVTRMN